MTLSDEEQTSVRDAVTAAVLGAADVDLEKDPAASLRLLEVCRTADLQTSQLVADAVGGARGAGHSWDTIGRLLGTTRQAAQQRFTEARPAAPGSDGGSQPEAATGEPQPERKVLQPLTAFTEMAALKDAGLHGWHVVDYGALHHVVEASSWQWEHARAPWSPAIGSRMAEDGWTLINTMTFPWGYYTRQTDVAALPED